MHTVKHTHMPQWYTHTSVNGITRAEESGCWIFPPFLCQPFISRSEGREGGGGARERGIQRVRDGKRERERRSLHSPAGYQPRTFCTGLFVGGNREYVSIPHEPDLPVGLSAHLLSVGFPVCFHISLCDWLSRCVSAHLPMSLYAMLKVFKAHTVEETSELMTQDSKYICLCSFICSCETCSPFQRETSLSSVSPEARTQVAKMAAEA